MTVAFKMGAPAEPPFRPEPKSLSKPSVAHLESDSNSGHLLRELACAADRSSAVTLALGELWQELAQGLCRVGDSYFSDERCFVLTVARAAQSAAIEHRRIGILQAVLSCGSQKVVAIDTNASYSSVSASARLALEEMGALGKPSRAHPILILAAKAASELASETRLQSSSLGRLENDRPEDREPREQPARSAHAAHQPTECLDSIAGRSAPRNSRKLVSSPNSGTIRPQLETRAALSFVTWNQTRVRVISVARPDRQLSGILTKSELAVTRTLIEGKSQEEIAQLRGTSIRTVANQTASIFRRLRVSGRAELLLRLLARDQDCASAQSAFEELKRRPRDCTSHEPRLAGTLALVNEPDL